MPYLRQALSSTRWLARMQAMHVLSKMGRFKDADRLVPLVGDEVDAVASHAYWAAAQTHNPSVVPALVGQLDPEQWSGLALGMGLERTLILRTGIPDIRYLRSAGSSIAAQMQDLEPCRPISMLPSVCRDISIVIDKDTDASTSVTRSARLWDLGATISSPLRCSRAHVMVTSQPESENDSEFDLDRSTHLSGSP
jgi:hypothetical protein